MNPANTAKHLPEPTHDEIALCAFLLWEKEGRQPGRETTYWLQAEAQLRMTRQQQAAAAAAKAARPWPPQTGAAPKLATARAVLPATAKNTKVAAEVRDIKPAAATKPAARKSASSAPARKAVAARA